MSTVTEPIVLDKTFAEKIDALNHLISHQNAAIDLLQLPKWWKIRQSKAISR